MTKLPERMIRQRNAAVQNSLLIHQGNLLHQPGRKLNFSLHAMLLFEAVHDGIEEVPAQPLEHPPGLKEAAVGIPGRPLKIFSGAEGFGNRSVDADV